MAQYNAGSLSILDGGTTATGVDTQFLGNVESGDYLLVFNQFNQSVHVATITAVGSDTSVTFSPAYNGADLSGVTYAMTTDFTALKNLALMFPGDLGAADLFNRNMQQIEQALIDQDAKLSFEAVKHAAMSEAEFEAKRTQNNRLYKASGFVHFGYHIADSSTWSSVNVGMSGIKGEPSSEWANRCLLGWVDSDAIDDKDKSAKPYPVVNMAGVTTKLSQVNARGNGQSYENTAVVKLPAAPDGAVTYDSATGAVVQHVDAATAFAAETTSNKVVAERYDLLAFQARLKTVTVADPWVYPNGLPQQLAATMNGIATVSTGRDASEYSVFDGDVGSAGLGVNYFSLSDADKAKLLADPDNNLFINNAGEPQFWEVMQKTFAGPGNGGWESIDPATGEALRFDQNSPVLSPAGQAYVASSEYPGLYEDGAGYYLLPLLQVGRLNQAGYHKSHNPFGTKYATGGNLWYQNNNFIDKASCFDPANYLANSGSISSGLSARGDGRYHDGVYVEGMGGVVKDNRLSAYKVGISDGAVLDAKNKNGQARGFQYLPFTRFMATQAAGGGGHKVNIYLLDLAPKVLAKWLAAPDGTKAHLLIPGFACYNLYGSADTTEVCWKYGTNLYVGSGGSSSPDGEVLITVPRNLPVSGEFTQSDVIGDPVNIKASADLVNGWLGGFIGIPDNTNREFESVRKVISIGDSQYTTNNGASWNSEAGTHWGWDAVKSSWTVALGASTVAIENYIAHAYVTESANKPVVYNGAEGLGDVFAAQSYFSLHGALLAESTLGKVLKGTASPYNSLYSLNKKYLDVNTGKLYSAAGLYEQRHEGIDLPLPNNNSIAFKTLPLYAVENGQLFPYYLSTELIWDTTLDDVTEFEAKDGTTTQTYVAGQRYTITGLSTQIVVRCEVGTTLVFADLTEREDGSYINNPANVIFTKWVGNGWGDDGVITVLDGESTKPDLNGNTVKVTCHKGVEPVGWV